MPVPAHNLARSLTDYAMSVQGRSPRAATVMLVFDDGESVEVKLPERLMLVASAGTELADEPTSVDDALLRVINSLAPNAVISAEELADRAGHSLNGWTRERLAVLVRDGRIKGHGRRGYGPIAPV